MGVELSIDEKDFILPTNNFNKKVKKKTQIVIGNTFSSDMKHFDGWLGRCNGNYRKTAAFTIDLNGRIHQHYNPKYYSDFINKKDVNEFIIPIVIENEGWLRKDLETGKLYTWTWNEVSDDVLIVEKRWRNHLYWAGYSHRQLDSLVSLVKHLCGKFNIPVQTIGHNTKVDNIYNYNGVVFRSNYLKQYTDLSPAFDYDEFKNKLENEK